MPSQGPRPDRHVIPRWRSPRRTARLGELNSVRAVSPSPEQPSPLLLEQLEHLRRGWTRTRAAGHLRKASSMAVEALGFAVAAGLEADVSPEVAFLEDQQTLVTPGGQRLVARVRAHMNEQPTLPLRTPPGEFPEPNSRQRIAELKAAVRTAPRNALAWVELARHYAVLGQHRHALRAMRTGHALAPTNRFVLRSAARLHLVTGDPEQAHWIILSAPSVQQDPWLLASELALAAEADRTPRFVRRAKQLMARGELPAFHISELASELATLELAAGKSRKARQLFSMALADPHENGLAQAEWALPQLPQLVVNTQLLEVPNSYEARAREARQGERWEEALAEASYWLYDERFSVEAATFASYVAATTLNKFQTAERVARIGLRAHPHSALLRNNLAFALAQQGRLGDATVELAAVTLEEQDVGDRVALAATAGLIAYRSGDPIMGRPLYDQAITKARQAGHREEEALASFYLAVEELRVGSPDARILATRAIGLARRQAWPEYKALVTQLERLLAEPPRRSDRG